MTAATEDSWPWQTAWREKMDEFKQRDPEGYQKEFSDFWITLGCGAPEISASIAERIENKISGLDHISMARKLTLRSCDSALVLKPQARVSLCRMARWPLAARKDTICE